MDEFVKQIKREQAEIQQELGWLASDKETAAANAARIIWLNNILAEHEEVLTKFH